MALNAPSSQDVQDIQFKVHDRLSIFSQGKELKNLVSLLAVSSVKGLLFAGNPNCKELKVFKIRDIVDSKTSGQHVKVRVITLPGEPKVLACSCDGSLLAVNYVSNNTGFLQIYQVDSFVASATNILYNIPVAPESHTFALQLLWNPVIANNIALVLTDGSVAMFTLNNGGQYDKVTLGKEHQVKSGCWSPKGKQIVFGFAEGKLQQFKPNLQPARAISCPPGIHPGPFDCIAVHWLSTFQFAAVFLQRGQEMCPSLFIINAPKTVQPSYINYYDVCYSAPGPRVHQLSFHYIPQWNILLVISANGVEVGVMGTKETGDIPNWIQYTLLDEARIEMPLTESKDETYPLGFVFDTSSSHQVVLGEKKLPVMPMIHVLSTHGQLISYNFLNLSPNAVDVCSPPPPINDISGQFVNLSETITESGATETVQIMPVISSSNVTGAGKTNKQSLSQGFGDNPFILGSNLVTSTPEIKDKPIPLFGSQLVVPKPTPGGGFSTTVATSTPAVLTTTPVSNTAPLSQQFGGMATGTPFSNFSGTGFTAKPNEPKTQPQNTSQPISTAKNADVNKPLYTVPPTFTPPNVQQTQQQQAAKTEIKSVASSNKFNLNTGEMDEVVKQMIVIQIEAFETELKEIRQQSSRLMENIGSPNAIKSYTKHLNDLQEIIEQANDHEFEQDVQSLRHSMNESYAMLAECRTKLDLYNNPNLSRLSTVSSSDPTSRRQLAKLQAYVASNQNQLYQLNQLIDAQWSQYQDVVRRNSKNQMHIPCLDGIYQRMSKLKDLLGRQRTKMNYIKEKLKQKGLHYKPSSDVDITSAAVGALTKNQSTMESLADSILSMSLSQVVSQTHAKLSDEKLDAIRNFTKRQQKIAIIKPKRPDRVGLKSEVILETKLETERRQKEMVKKQQQQQQQQQQQLQQLYQQQYQQQYLQQYQQIYQQQYLQQYQQQQQQFAAYKTPINMQAPPSTKHQQQQNYQTQMPQQLVKPQATLSASQQPVLAKPTASKPIVSSHPPTFITPTSSTAATLSFGGNSSFVKTSMSASKLEEISRPIATSTPFTAFGVTTSQAGHNFNQSKPAMNIAPSIGNGGKENKPNSTPISFSAKVIGGNDIKPFANLGNKTVTQANLMQSSSQAPTSTGFMTLAITKPTTQIKNQDKDTKKQPEQFSKELGFPTVSASSTPITTAPVTFVASNKSTTTTTPFTAPSVASTTTANITLFSALSSSSPFTFNSTVTTSSTIAPTPTATNLTKTGASITRSSQPTAVSTAKSDEIKTSTIITVPTTTPATSVPSSFSFNNSAASNITATDMKSSAGLIEDKPAAATTESSDMPTSTEDPTDILFDSLNICKPTAKESGDSNKSTNIYAGFAFATSPASTGSFSFASTGDGAQSSLNTTNPSSGTTASTGLAFASSTTATTPATAANLLVKPATVETTAAAASNEATTTSTLSFTENTKATLCTTAAQKSTTTSTFSFAETAAPTASTAASLFGSLSVSSTAVTSTAANLTMPTTAATGNIFGGGSSLFGQATTAATTSTTASIFQGGAAVASSPPSLFASTVPTATTAATPGSGSIFSSAISATPQSTGSIFAGIPKPEQSVFGATNTQPAGTGLFASAAAISKPASAAGGNIFGGGSTTGFGAPTGGSIFGGGNNTPSNPFGSAAPSNTAGSLFGVAANKPTEGGGIFGSPTQQSPTSGGSIFSKTSFGATTAPQSTGSIFGGGNALSPTSGGFATTGGSIFGGSNIANAAVSGGSLFSATPASTAPAFGAPTSPGFGSFSQPSTTNTFGSPTSGGFGASASGGFGSPQQQSVFAKPVFGGPGTFGSPQPAFGSQSTFGGAPAFGSPKGFGSFASTSPNATSFGAPTQGAAAPTGNIFETLGSQDSALSFGNLAHSTQASQQKPTFGGSSFMNYRS